MTQRKRQYFTPDDYKRLARNPFVDKQMLQFVKNKTVTPPAAVDSAALRQPAGNRQVGARTYSSGRSAVPSRTSSSRPPMSEKTAQLIAMAIKAMLRG